VKGISVVICCYNSSRRLPETLRHLSLQKPAKDLAVEVVLIDNNSNDDTAISAKQFWGSQRTSIPLKVVSEPRPGLSFARQKGFETAQYEYILLCDDDNWLDENYLQRAFAIMESNASIGALGGSSTPAFETEPPRWYELVKNSYAVGTQASQTGKVPDSRGYLWGAGLVLRKSALEALTKKGFSTILTDRKGKSITSGGDGELCAALRLMGYELYYDEALRFQHYMTRDRLTWPYYLKLAKSFGQARVYLGFYDFVMARRAGKPTTPENYWQAAWRDHKKIVFADMRRLVRQLIRPLDGKLSTVELQMKIGGLQEMLKVKRSYKKYIDHIDRTFS
jgi:glycosyltransferase involved in cell wall biosynthesis